MTIKPTASLSAIALALVLPATVVQAHDWTGFYAGASGGYSFGSVETGAVENNTRKKTPFEDIAAAFGNADPAGFEGSFFIGYRLQSDGLVYGFEGGISGGAAEGSAPNGFGESSISFGESYFLRGTVGTKVQGALVYGSLGLVSTNLITNDTNFANRFDEMMTGLTLGVGYERMLDEHLGVRAEINHTMYQDGFVISLLAPPSPVRTRADFGNTSVPVGVTYRF